MLFRGAYSIVLSRRISDTDGGFFGVVAGSIRFSYFHELFERLSLDPDDTITVLRRDRTVMMRRPFDLDVIGKNLADPAGLEGRKSEGRRRHSPDRGRWTDAAALCPQQRAGPLFVVAGKPLAAVFELWQKEAYRIGAVVWRSSCSCWPRRWCSPARSAGVPKPSASSRRWRRRMRSPA